jgi:hypothetical protein
MPSFGLQRRRSKSPDKSRRSRDSLDRPVSNSSSQSAIGRSNSNADPSYRALGGSGDRVALPDVQEMLEHVEGRPRARGNAFQGVKAIASKPTPPEDGATEQNVSRVIISKSHRDALKPRRCCSRSTDSRPQHLLFRAFLMMASIATMNINILMIDRLLQMPVDWKTVVLPPTLSGHHDLLLWKTL